MLLIHGGFVDGSGWERVFTRLRKDGYSVSVVQNPTTSLVDDLAATRRAIEVSGGPVILVGHSYGGPVITQAGNDPRVVGLVAWKTKPSWYLIATDDHMIPRRAAVHGQACRCDGRRNAGEPCGLCVSPGAGREADRAGGICGARGVVEIALRGCDVRQSNCAAGTTEPVLAARSYAARPAQMPSPTFRTSLVKRGSLRRAMKAGCHFMVNIDQTCSV